MLVIELNDSGLLAGDGAECRMVGAGYALVENGEILVGDSARGQARLRPREVTNRFWREFATGTSSTSPVAPADLVCAQLGDIRKNLEGAFEENVICAVPGFFGRDALGMLLGVAREAGLAVRGLVDSAVAATTGTGRASLLHLDLHLHVGVLTEISAGDLFRRGEVQVAEGSGLAGLEQSWVSTIAEAFVRQTRFDPLHQAASEQALFEGLWDWIEALGQLREVQVPLEVDGRNLSATVTRAQLIHAVEPHYERLMRLVEAARAARGIEAVILAHRAALLPGLSDRLLDTGVDVQALDAAAVLEGAAARSEHIVSGSDSVRFVTALPPLGDSAAPTAPPAPLEEDRRPPPTHLIQGSVAWKIDASPLEIGVSPSGEHRSVVVRDKVEGVSRRHCLVYRNDGAVLVQDESRYGTWVNDRRVSGTAELRAGDVLRVGSPGSRMLLVAARD
jgi:hypothetical protein